MHPLLMPLVAASLLGSPGVPRVLAEVSSTHVQTRVLEVSATPIDGPLLPMDKLRPRWTGEVGGVPLAIVPKKETGGFKIDLEIQW